MATTLTELTYSYPKQTVEDFQEQISERREFGELALEASLEKIAAKGDLFNHQRYNIRFLTIYSNLLLYNLPGTGKTLIGWGIGEEMRKSSTLSPAKAYIMGKNNTIRKMVIFVPGDNVESAWTESYGKASELKKIPDFYEIAHYQSFYERSEAIVRTTSKKSTKDTPYVPKPKLSIEELKSRYDNSIIFFDEIQEALNRSKDVESRAMYDFFRWFLSILSNVIVVLATGTPIIMSAAELSLIMNLFPRDVIPMPVSKKLDQEEDSIAVFYSSDDLEEKLKPYLSGHISYVKNVKRYVDLVYPKEAVSLSKKTPEYKVVRLTMPKAQNDSYVRSINSEGSFANTIPLQLSVYGSRLDTNNNIIRNDPVTLESINERSAKIKKILSFLDENKKGMKFITTDWVQSGVEMLKKALELKGFINFASGKKGRPALPAEKARRYLILEENNKMYDITRKWENRHGEYIEVIIGSEKGSIALSLSNVVYFIQLDPPKHKSEEEQRLGRIIRPDSYTHLYNERMDALLEQGKSEEDAAVPVEVYNLVADPIDPNIKSVDANTYLANIHKDESLVPIRTVMWRIAYDAQLAKKRNQEHENDIKYGFSGKQVKLGSNSSSYNLIYSDQISKPVINEFISSVISELAVDVDEFWNREPRTINQIAFYRYLTRLIKSGGQVTTNTGEIIYLKRDRNVVFVQREDRRAERSLSSVDNSIYATSHALYISDNPLTIKRTTNDFNDIVSVEDLTRFLNIEVSGKRDLLNDKIELIEYILTHPENKELYNEIMRRYGNKYIFIFRKPNSAITQLSSITQLKVRRTTANNLVNIEQDGEEVLVHLFRNLIDIQTNNSYTIFTYFFQAEIISILDRKTQEFNILKVDTAEQLVYARLITPTVSRMFNDMITRMSAKGEQGLIWGAKFDPEMILRIYDNRQSSNSSGIKKKRTKCHTSYLSIEYLDIIVYLGIDDELPLTEKIPLPKGKMETGLDWVKAIKGILKTGEKHSTSLNKLIEERKDYYSHPNNYKKGERLYRLYASYVVKNKKIKVELNKILFRHFEKNDMIAYF